MKSTAAAAIIAALALLAPGTRAQTPASGAPAAATTSPPAPVKMPSRAKGGSSTPADARVCLEFENNLQVIQCAEKYRHMKAPA
jgi:hypothetical protein